jgi:hypothetical protein
MAEGVKYNKLADAKAYATEVNGQVIAHDTNEDGTPDIWTVVVEDTTTEKDRTTGTDLKDLDEGTPEYEQHKKYLEDVEAAGKPLEEGNRGGVFVDELGYRHGGMPHGKRDPIKYAAGGAVRGKRFVGSF